jgi:hypothetical protein
MASWEEKGILITFTDIKELVALAGFSFKMLTLNNLTLDLQRLYFRRVASRSVPS